MTNCLDNCSKNFRSTDGETKKKPYLVRQKTRRMAKNATTALFILWCFINAVFLYRVATMPEDWLLVSTYQPLTAFLTFNAVIILAFCYIYRVYGNPVMQEIEILRDGSIKTYKMYDYGFFEWRTKKTVWRNEDD